MITLLAACAITVFALLAEHWFPWHQLLGRKVQPPISYVAGVLTLFGPFALVAWVNGQYECICWLAAICVSGGAAVVCAYLVDGWLQNRNRVQDAEYRREVNDIRERFDAEAE